MPTLPRLVLALLALTPAVVEGQLAGFGGPLAQADMLYLAGEPLQAFEIIDQYLATDSTDYDALWRAARAAVVLGIDAEGSRPQNAWLDPAMAFAERAVAVRPDGVDGLYWRGVAVGRRAMNASPGYAVELAQVVYDDAHAILAADSTHGGAHNMLGKLNYEIMSLSRFKRGVARTFMGNSALDDTSWENALHHLQKATETWPDFVLFHFDLGQLHRKRGRREEAARSFLTALSLEPVHPPDRKAQRDARAYLEEWGLLATADSTSVSADDAPTGR